MWSLTKGNETPTSLKLYKEKCPEEWDTFTNQPIYCNFDTSQLCVGRKFFPELTKPLNYIREYLNGQNGL